MGDLIGFCRDWRFLCVFFAFCFLIYVPTADALLHLFLVGALLFPFTVSAASALVRVNSVARLVARHGSLPRPATQKIGWPSRHLDGVASPTLFLNVRVTPLTGTLPTAATPTCRRTASCRVPPRCSSSYPSAVGQPAPEHGAATPRLSMTDTSRSPPRTPPAPAPSLLDSASRPPTCWPHCLPVAAGRQLLPIPCFAVLIGRAAGITDDRS